MLNEDTEEVTFISMERMTYLGGLGFRPVQYQGHTVMRVPASIYEQELAALESLRMSVARATRARRLAKQHA